MMMTKRTIQNPHSGCTIIVEPEDPLAFDEMLREQASYVLKWIGEHRDEHPDLRVWFAASLGFAVDIARRRGCSKKDWRVFVGYAGLLASQAYAEQMFEEWVKQ